MPASPISQPFPIKFSRIPTSNRTDSPRPRIETTTLEQLSYYWITFSPFLCKVEILFWPSGIEPGIEPLSWNETRILYFSNWPSSNPSGNRFIYSFKTIALWISRYPLEEALAHIGNIRRETIALRTSVCIRSKKNLWRFREYSVKIHWIVFNFVLGNE